MQQQRIIIIEPDNRPPLIVWAILIFILLTLYKDCSLDSGIGGQPPGICVLISVAAPSVQHRIEVMGVICKIQPKDSDGIVELLVADADDPSCVCSVHAFRPGRLRLGAICLIEGFPVKDFNGNFHIVRAKLSPLPENKKRERQPFRKTVKARSRQPRRW